MSQGTPKRTEEDLGIASGFSKLARYGGKPGASLGFRDEYGGGLVIVAGVLALIVANTAWSEWYEDLLESNASISVGGYIIQRTVHEWINDALMALFFFVAALELKKETTSGTLSSWKLASAPLCAALCGMAVPVGLYFGTVAVMGGEGMKGWGIPMATDIAFALVILALLGKGLPRGLRVFLLALAIVDDAGAILVIAVFYSSSISWLALLAAAGLALSTWIISRLGAKSFVWYVVPGILLWLAVAESGVHATIAGVVFGLLIPHRPGLSKKEAVEQMDTATRRLEEADQSDDSFHSHMGVVAGIARYSESPLDALNRAFKPFVFLLILPVFAFANAGVEITGEMLGKAIGSPPFYGILLGLLLGKPLGITLGAWVVTRMGWGTLPEGAKLKHVLACGMLGGIGFTVSLFIAELAFGGGGDENDIARISVLLASVLSSAVAWLYVAFFLKEEGSAD